MRRVRWRHLQAALRQTEAHPISPERCRVLIQLVSQRAPDFGAQRGYACAALRLLRRHPDPQLWCELLGSLAAIRDPRRLRRGRSLRLVRRRLQLAEQHELWDQALDARANLANHWVGTDIHQAIAEAGAALQLAEAGRAECTAPSWRLCFLPAWCWLGETYSATTASRGPSVTS